MTHREMNRKLVEKGMEVCSQMLREGKNIPFEGAFNGYHISFDLKGSKNTAMFFFEHDSGNIRRLRFTVYRPGRDLAVNYYMTKGTNEELAQYLSDKSRIDEFTDDFQKLSDSVDEH